ncbi:hypothetical protein Tco_0077072 [Tanacetum coccineum]
MNCPLDEDFTKIPSVVYQNLLREFWCTAIATHPNPPTDDFEVRPLKEYKIKFSVMNGKKPLTLDYKTFVESTGLDYAKGTYVLGGNYSSSEQVNFIQQLIAYCLLIGTKVDIGEIIYMLLGPDYTHDESFGSSPTILSNSNFSKDPFKVTPIELMAFMVIVNNHEHSVSLLPYTVKKKKKGKSQTVTPTLPQSQGLKTSGALPQKRKNPKSKKTPSETKVTPPRPTEGSKQSHSVSSGTDVFQKL